MRYLNSPEPSNLVTLIPGQVYEHVIPYYATPKLKPREKDLRLCAQGDDGELFMINLATGCVSNHFPEEASPHKGPSYAHRPDIVLTQEVT